VGIGSDSSKKRRKEKNNWSSGADFLGLAQQRPAPPIASVMGFSVFPGVGNAWANAASQIEPLCAKKLKPGTAGSIASGS
jgi:hypothetical protein